jgi:transcriptional regulator with XRE-family HTH domain
MLATRGLLVKSKEEPKQVGEFADALLDAMAKKQMDIGDLAKKIGTTYEHARKLVKTYAFPSKLLLEKICHVLNMELDHTQRLVVADKIKHKYGSIPQELAGKTPRFEEIERILPKLTDEQFRMFVNIGKSMVKTNQG